LFFDIFVCLLLFVVGVLLLPFMEVIFVWISPQLVNCVHDLPSGMNMGDDFFWNENGIGFSPRYMNITCVQLESIFGILEHLPIFVSWLLYFCHF